MFDSLYFAEWHPTLAYQVYEVYIYSYYTLLLIAALRTRTAPLTTNKLGKYFEVRTNTCITK